MTTNRAKLARERAGLSEKPTRLVEAEAALRDALEANGGYLTAIDFDDAYAFAREQLASYGKRNADLRLVNAFRALAEIAARRKP